MIKRMEQNVKNTQAVMELWKRSTIKGHPFITESYWLDQYSKVKTVYLPLSETYVYEEDGKIKGFISVIEKNFIGALFVDVEVQNQGVGKKLIEYVKMKYDNLRLTVYCKNERAVQFYLKNGFDIEEKNLNQETREEEYTMIYRREIG